MKSETAEDPILHEIPVYLSKSLSGKVFVLQYPLRPVSHTYDHSSFKAKMKPQSCQVELEMALTTRGPTYEKSKGEQIALNADGTSRDKREPEDCYFSSNAMDKLVFTSSVAASDIQRYGVAVVGETGCHISPVTAVVAMRPSFSYLDIAEKRSRSDVKDNSEDCDEEEKLRRVSVRFEKPDNERTIMMRERSFGFLQKKVLTEPWIKVDFNNYGSEISYYESGCLFCGHQEMQTDQFSLDEASYLSQLIPSPSETETSVASLPSHLLSRAALASMPLQDRLQTLLLNARIATFSELLCASATGRGKNTPAVIIKALQQVAVLVQGNWVIKSDILYPKEGVSELGLPNELLQKGRDFILFLFTKSRVINRCDVEAEISFHVHELTEILKGVARKSKGGSWEFIQPPDEKFISEYADVVQRQAMIWESRHEQILHVLRDKSEVFRPFASKKRK